MLTFFSPQDATRRKPFKIHYIIPILFVFIALAASAFFYIRQLEELFAKRAVDELSRSSHTITAAFKSRIMDKMEGLKALAVFIARFDKINDPAVLDTLRAYSKQQGFAHLAVIMPSGVSYADDYTVHQTADREYFIRAMGGQSSFSGPYVSRIDGKQSLVLATPIHKGDTIRGVLRSAELAQEYEDFLRQIVVSGTTQASVIRPSGEIIAGTGGGPFEQGNLYDALEREGVISAPEREALLRDLGTGTSRLIRYSAQGEERFLFFNAALDDLYVVTALPVSYATANVFDVLTRTAYLMGALFLFFVVLIVYMVRSRSDMAGRIRRVNQELQSVIANTPGGTMRTLDDAELRIKFLSEGFMTLTGYSREAIHSRFGDRYLRLLHPDDLESVMASRKAQLMVDDAFELEYRLSHAHRGYIHVLEKGRRVAKLSTAFVYSTIIDVSEANRLMEQSQISAESLRQLLAISGSSLFELDLHSGVIVFSNQFSEKSGWPVQMERFPQSALDEGLVHEQDVEIFLAFIDKLYDGHIASDAEVRLLGPGGRYVWYSLAATVVFDKNHVAVKVIGKIEDIDQEKRSLAALREISLRDTFTGLYNKSSSGQLISECLGACGADTRGGLFIIDVDNFKSVNDNLGHPVGDKVLKELADALAHIFRTSDIVGRLGGDEFVVYMRNAQQPELYRAKAEAVCQAFRRQYSVGERHVAVSASVGVAMFPDDGQDYATLYQRADTALYQAKRGGKNRYVFAEDCLDG